MYSSTRRSVMNPQIGTFSQSTNKSKQQVLCTQDEARQIAKDIWDEYQQGGTLREDSLRKMMVQIYLYMNQDFNPSPQDIDGYQKVIDLNGTGNITPEDLEEHCILLLCGGSQQEQKEQPKMSAKRQAWIDQKKKVAERIFKKYDGGRGYITKDQVGSLIRDTYAQIGIQKDPSLSEIEQWMVNNDKSGDGKVELNEYTESITEALMELASELEID